MLLNQSFDPAENKNPDTSLQIPRIIHQTWKDQAIPDKYLAFQKSWRTYLPKWEYRLWTDEANRTFLEKHYDWFLPIYDAYPKPIMRVDAVRYFWMYHFGGLYVDLDFEALKSIEPLLLNQKTVIGLEPEDHLKRPFLQKYGFKHILCNALMASVPKAPFWEFMVLQLIKHHKEEDPLAATGPFCLTQGYDSFKDKSSISLIPSELLYPIYEGASFNHLKNKSETNSPISNEAYGIHHWAGSWWRDFAGPPPRLIDLLGAKFQNNFPTIYDKLRKFKNRLFPMSNAE